MDDKRIDDILSELYAADDSLRGREVELRAALRKLLAARPDTPHDEAYLASLRADLIKKYGSRPMPTKYRFLDTLGRPMFVIPAAAFAVLLIAVVATQQRSPGGTLNLSGEPSASAPFDGGFSVKKVASGDFGTLLSSEGAPQAAPGFGGGAGLAMGEAGKMAPNAAYPVAPPVTDTAVSVDPSRGMILPEGPYMMYTYAYKGEPLSLPDARLPVLRRIKGQANVPLSDAMRAAFPGLLDVSRIDGLRLQNFAAFQDKPFGLSVYADMFEESVSVSQYYQQWPHPEQQCRDEACYQGMRLRLEDMLEDTETIALADRFLDELGVNRDGYGAPQVRDDWRRWYAMSTDRAAYWFPDTVTVIYPMIVDGNEVVDEAGYGYGITVNVNVRHNRADGVWNLMSRNYESADYAAVTDPAKLLEVVSRGGVWGYVPEGEVTKVEIELGAPSRVLLRTWQYSVDGIGKELLVPGLRFPVNDPDRATRGTPEFITVPLVTELLERPGYGGGVMPLMKDLPATTQPAVSEPAVR